MLLSLKENKSPTKFQISVFLNRENSSEVFFIVIRRVHSLNSCKKSLHTGIKVNVIN